MTKLAVIVILASVVITAYSLKCYQCTSKKCDDVSQAPSITCDSSPNLQYRCFKRVEKDKATSALNTTRGCHILRNDNDKSYCNIQDPAKTENVFCDVCNEDLCNSATNFNVNAGTIAAITLSVFAARIFAN